MSRRKKKPTPAPIPATEVDVVPTEVVPVPEVEVESARPPRCSSRCRSSRTRPSLASLRPLDASHRSLLRFGVAFLIGLVAAMALGVGALYAYDQQYVGRVLPGVDVGGVDLSGMTESEASATLDEAYASLGEGSVVVTGPDGDVTYTFDDLGRTPTSPA